MHPSAIAALRGIASKTAASTSLRPLCVTGDPATTGTEALALKHSLKSSSSRKLSKRMGWSVSRHEATICTKNKHSQEAEE